ncbi:DUF4097 family beta strand repeat-containing protein [Rhizosphaericola mali]|uniref:DUF4097 domain-containing protein n=1 Tax=Rhizosphaericola mali TaxID=2545455 RepID=A0A5P2G0Y6_9BACT|nr:DUF4097 family beta strand repeat-containing protein [Rhizosphaericola mali]QES89095.1 DUF4097 domain-containing protein [Rhizosphaericola mali]
MKKILLGVLIVAAISTTSCSININGVNAMSTSDGVSEKYLIKTQDLDAAQLKKIIGYSASSDFLIYGDGDQKAYVEVYVQSQNKKQKKEDLEKLLNQRSDVSIVQNGETLTIASNTKKGITWSNSDRLNVSFKIHVPNHIATTLTTSSGDIAMENLSGDVKIKTTSGDVSGSTIKGELNIETASGDIQLSVVKSQSIHLNTASGDIQIENAKTNTLAIGTASGDVRITDANGNTTIGTASGDINVKLNSGSLVTNSASGDQQLTILNPITEVKLNAGSGDINLSVPKTVKANIDLKGSSVYMANNMGFKDANINNKSTNGILNGGGMPISIRTGSGDIHLNWN